MLERKVENAGRRTRYTLTAAGRELQPVIAALLEWGAAWAFGEPRSTELNPLLLMWWMRDRVHRELLPQARVVVEFDFRLPSAQHYWMVLERSDVSVCLTHPGFAVDVVVLADLAAFHKVWLGRRTFSDAVRDQQVELDALPRLMRAFPDWFAWSAAAETVRVAAQRTQPA